MTNIFNTSNRIRIQWRKFLLVGLSTILLLNVLTACSLNSKNYVYENLAFGMTKAEVKKAVKYDLDENSNGSLSYHDTRSKENQVSYYYYFDEDGGLKDITIYYSGDKYTEGNFFDKTKRELDSKHGQSQEYHKKNVDEKYGLVWYYDGYEWLCDGYNVLFIHWEDGILMLNFSLDD